MAKKSYSRNLITVRITSNTVCDFKTVAAEAKAASSCVTLITKSEIQLLNSSKP